MKLNLQSMCTSQPIEVLAPPGLAPSAFDAIIKGLDTLNRRQIRMETRLVRLMKDHGLDSTGNPTDNH